MLTSQAVIDAVANRIEQAYRLRRPSWRGGCSTDRVWAAAAVGLIDAYESDPDLPLDPELFVAAQPIGAVFQNAWDELTGPAALDRYRDRVRSIVRRLRSELAGEIRRAESLIGTGRSAASVLSARGGRLSPLGRFIVALRAGRPALAARYRNDAVAQHRSCPLYRQASAELMPVGSYPVTAGAPVPPAVVPIKPRALSHPQRN